MTRRVSVVVAALALACVLGVGTTACKPTTYDASDESAAPTVPETTLAISSDPLVVLPLLLAEVSDLPQRVVDSDGDGAAATRIEAMWAAIKPSVKAEHPEMVTSFDFLVRRCRAAADRNRPADADRALKNLESLVDAYLTS